MSVLLIDAEAEKLIKRTIETAKAKPIPLEMLMAGAVGPKAHVSLSDRKPGFERPASEHIMLGNIRVACSFEWQPAGLCCHISISVQTPGRLPHPATVAVICDEFGMHKAAKSIHSQKIDEAVQIWTEEFDPGHSAVNVVELMEPKRGE